MAKAVTGLIQVLQAGKRGEGVTVLIEKMAVVQNDISEGLSKKGLWVDKKGLIKKLEVVLYALK